MRAIAGLHSAPRCSPPAAARPSLRRQSACTQVVAARSYCAGRVTLARRCGAMPSTSTTPPPLPSTSAYPARRLAWGAAAVAAGLAGAYLLLGSRGRRMVANALPMASGGKSKEQRVLEHVLSTAPAGQPDAVLAALDSYGWGQEFLMNVGDVKGKILDDAVAAAVARGAKVFLEIGAYCGYSAVRIARQLPPGAQLFSVEVSPANAQVAEAVIRHAGLQAKATLLVGDVAQGIESLRGRGVDHVDLCFIDHHKALYVQDFKLMRDQGFLRRGAVVVADNLLWPGAPDFIKLMKDSPDQFEFVMHDTQLEYSKDTKDAVGVAVMRT